MSGKERDLVAKGLQPVFSLLLVLQFLQIPSLLVLSALQQQFFTKLHPVREPARDTHTARERERERQVER